MLDRFFFFFGTIIPAHYTRQQHNTITKTIKATTTTIRSPQEHLHIDRSESTVGNGTADSTGKGELAVELKAIGGGGRGLTGHYE